MFPGGVGVQEGGYGAVKRGESTESDFVETASGVDTRDDRYEVLQLTTLWFVVLTFLQTGSGNLGGLGTAVGILAILLSYLLPATILVLLGSRLLED